MNTLTQFLLQHSRVICEVKKNISKIIISKKVASFVSSTTFSIFQFSKSKFQFLMACTIWTQEHLKNCKNIKCTYFLPKSYKQWNEVFSSLASSRCFANYQKFKAFWLVDWRILFADWTITELLNYYWSVHLVNDACITSKVVNNIICIGHNDM